MGSKNNSSSHCAMVWPAIHFIGQPPRSFYHYKPCTSRFGSLEENLPKPQKRISNGGGCRCHASALPHRPKDRRRADETSIISRANRPLFRCSLSANDHVTRQT